MAGLLSFSTGRATSLAPLLPHLPELPEDIIIYGDANDDGSVNVLGIITVVNHILGINPDPFNFDAADVNNDDVINVPDIIFTTNIIPEMQGTPCPGDPIVIYDGHIYNTVLIGDQCWFRENLNIGNKVDSDEKDEAMDYVTTEGARGITDHSTCFFVTNRNLDRQYK